VVPGDTAIFQQKTSQIISITSQELPNQIFPVLIM